MKASAFALAAATAALTLVGSAAAIHDVNERFVGGGWIEDPNILGDPTARIHIGLEIPCGIEDPNIRPNLQVSWSGNTFHLSEMSAAACAGIGVAGTLVGEGVGVCNGARATARFELDADSELIVVEGQPNGDVVRQLSIAGSAPGCALSITQTALGGGNFRFIEDPNI